MQKNCLNCGKIFIPSHKYLKVIQKFCSLKCRQNQLVSNCLICKKEYTWDKHGKKIRKYCSKECMRLGRRNRIYINCKNCSKKFFVRASRLKYVNAQFCSKKCMTFYQSLNKKSRSEILKKYNNKPDIKLKKQEYYFGGFYKYRLRDKAIKRDNYSCRICNSKKNIIVHHYDGNRLNNILKNLVTLCRNCHPTVHGSWGLKTGWLC